MPSAGDKIQQLETLEREELVGKWIKAYGTPPFKGARHKTLIRGLAYHIQSRQYGGLPVKTSKRVIRIAKSGIIAGTGPAISKKPKTKLGSQLIREWNGKTYTVHVTDNGYVMSGVTYGSLSSAAKAITGAHWSGPRFFGVAG